MTEQNKRISSVFPPIDSDWQMTACVNFGSPDWYAYAKGFYLAAESAIQMTRDSDSCSPDYMIYPITFLYRHYLELSFKATLIQLDKLNLQIPSFPKSHKLGPLLKELEQRCRVVLDDVCIPWDVLEEVIPFFDKFDPTSETFRYPVRKDGAPTIECLKCIGLSSMHTKMSAVLVFFDTLEFGLDKREYELTNKLFPQDKSDF